MCLGRQFTERGWLLICLRRVRHVGWLFYPTVQVRHHMATNTSCYRHQMPDRVLQRICEHRIGSV